MEARTIRFPCNVADLSHSHSFDIIDKDRTWAAMIFFQRHPARTRREFQWGPRIFAKLL